MATQLEAEIPFLHSCPKNSDAQSQSYPDEAPHRDECGYAVSPSLFLSLSLSAALLFLDTVMLNVVILSRSRVHHVPNMHLFGKRIKISSGAEYKGDLRNCTLSRTYMCTAMILIKIKISYCRLGMTV